MNAKEEADSKESWQIWSADERIFKGLLAHMEQHYGSSSLFTATVKATAREAFAAGFAAGKEQR